MSTVRIDWHGGEVTQKIRDAANRGLDKAANHLLAKANEKVPHDKGILENSGKTSAIDLHARVSYDTPYARYLHEHPEFNFQGGREGKWLQNAADREQDKIAQIIADEIRAGT